MGTILKLQRYDENFLPLPSTAFLPLPASLITFRFP